MCSGNQRWERSPCLSQVTDCLHFNMYIFPSLVSSAKNESNLARKGFIWLMCPNHSSLWRESKAGTWKQKLKQRPLRSATYWVAHYGYWTCFLIPSRTACPGVVHPQWAGPSHFNHESRECPHRVADRSFWRRHFFNWGSFFPEDPGLHHVDKEQLAPLSNIHGSLLFTEHILYFTHIVLLDNAILQKEFYFF